MGTAKSKSRPLRSVTLAVAMALGQMLLHSGAASASEAPEVEASADTVTDSLASSSIRSTSIEFGLGALLLMQRERREHRRVPKMLPLLASAVPPGQLWVGLARERSEAQPSRGVQLEVWWMIPLGR